MSPLAVCLSPAQIRLVVSAIDRAGPEEQTDHPGVDAKRAKALLTARRALVEAYRPGGSPWEPPVLSAEPPWQIIRENGKRKTMWGF